MFDVYPYEVRIVISNDLQKARANRNAELGLDPDTEVCQAWQEKMRNRAVSYLFLGLNAGSGVIAHECSHAIMALFKWIGARLEDEMFAYHLDYLVQQVTATYGENGLNGVIRVKP